MKKLIFLKNLKRKNIIELVEPSEEIESSYLVKSEECLKSAKILLKNNLYENSTSDSHYCMYNSLLSLLFKVGIKSENHSASIILFKELFKNKELAEIISWAKKERIDKQYYIKTQQTGKANRDSSGEIMLKAEDFLVKIKLLLKEINNEKIGLVRNSFVKMLK